MQVFLNKKYILFHYILILIMIYLIIQQKSFYLAYIFLFEFIIIKISGLSFKDSSTSKLLHPSTSSTGDLLIFLFYFTPFFSTAYFKLAVWTSNQHFRIYTFENQIYCFMLAIVIGSFLDYLLHVMAHRIPALWEMHKIHHSANQMTMLTSFREHLILNLVNTIIKALVFAVLGLNYSYFFYYLFLKNIHVNLIHSNIKKSLGPLSYILVSPLYHWIHHSKKPQHFNKNFSTDFAIWDIFFKTHIDETKISDLEINQITIGLEDLSFQNSNILTNHWMTIKNFVQISRR